MLTLSSPKPTRGVVSSKSISSRSLMVSIAGGKLALPYKRNNDMYQKLRIFALKKTKEKKLNNGLTCAAVESCMGLAGMQGAGS